MKQIYLFLLLIVLTFNQAFAQAKGEEEAVKATINLLFDGMRNVDTAMLRKAFATKHTLETIVRMKDGKSIVRTENINDFIKSIAIPHNEKYDERIGTSPQPSPEGEGATKLKKQAADSQIILKPVNQRLA